MKLNWHVLLQCFEHIIHLSDRFKKQKQIISGNTSLCLSFHSTVKSVYLWKQQMKWCATFRGSFPSPSPHLTPLFLSANLSSQLLFWQCHCYVTLWNKKRGIRVLKWMLSCPNKWQAGRMWEMERVGAGESERGKEKKERMRTDHLGGIW